TLTALAGGVGTAANFLETDLIDVVASGLRQGAKSGVLTVASHLGVYVDEIAGNLRVNTVVSTLGDVVLTTRSGSILDSNSATTTDRDGRTVDVPNVVGVKLSFAAHGGSIGTADDDLDIDSGVSAGNHVAGLIYAQADGSVYITESNYELNV